MSSAIELRSFGSFQQLGNSPSHRAWWWVPILWADPFRAFFGTLLLQQSLGLVSNRWNQTPKEAYALMLVLLILAMLSQTYSRRSQGVLLAPLSFTLGVVACLIPWTVSLIGLAMATTGMFAFRQFHAFFSIGFVVVLGLGFALEASVLWTAPTAGLFLVPLIASILKNSTLEIPTRTLAPAQVR